MAFNIFDILIGNPIDGVASSQYDAAFLQLKAARLKGDRVAELAALEAMKVASNKLQTQSSKVVGQVENIDKKIKAVTMFTSVSAVGVVGSLLLVSFIIYKLKK